MNYWIQNLDPQGSPEEIGVIQLAWLGDSVWELHQRLRHIHIALKSKDVQYPKNGLFHNEGGLDANMYGIVLNSKGIAINGFKSFIIF